MTRFLIPIILFGLLVIVFSVGLNLDPSFVPSPLIGKPVPQFSLARLNDPDRFLSDADLRGQVSLLNVWATWCVGCRQEHETLNQIAELGDVPIYGLNWKDDVEQASVWLTQLGNPYVATGVDADGKVAIDWGVYGAPETFLVDAEGIILYRHISPLSMEIWQTEFVPRINKARGNSG
ncbi:MAG: DsbE family thiol:disulfide interchange protein [Gammaproteobacteria bacterium]|nr:DsbE family thiol:disulfide interchange protein [Gammaproteobacteria bacterium]